MLKEIKITKRLDLTIDTSAWALPLTLSKQDNDYYVLILCFIFRYKWQKYKTIQNVL